MIELLQLAATTCDISLNIRLLPGARLQKELESGSIDAAGMLSYNDARSQYAAYPLKSDGSPDEALRLVTLSHALYVRNDHRLEWDGLKLQGLQRKVGTNLGWSINRDLDKMGIPIEPTNSVTQNFLKLQAGRIDAYATYESLGDDYLAKHAELSLVKLKPPLKSKSYYLVFSRSYAAHNPAVAACLWRQVGSQRERLYQQRMRDYLD